MNLSKIARCIRAAGSSSRFSRQLILGTVAIGSLSTAVAADVDYSDTNPTAASHLHTKPVLMPSSYPSGANYLYATDPTDPLDTPLVSDNHVTINYTSQTKPDYVLGGVVQDGVTENNNVVLNNGQIQKNIWGGFARRASGDATAEHNDVTLNGGSADMVFGGSVESFYPTGNGNSTITNNHVTMTGGTVTGKIYGGYYTNSGTNANNTTGTVEVSNNQVEITGGTVEDGRGRGFVTGGNINGNHAGPVVMNNNKVTIGRGVTVGSNVNGAELITNGKAKLDNNRVVIRGGTVRAFVMGVHSSGQGNNVDISGSSVDISDDAHVNLLAMAVNDSGSTVVNIKDSRVHVDHSTVANIMGVGTSAGSSTISGGHVDIDHSTIGEIDGVWNYGKNITATDNHITINDSITDDVYGAKDDSIPSATKTTTFTHNTISISGNSTIHGDIYGGQANNHGTTTDNTVTLNGADLNISGTLWGGRVFDTDHLGNDVTDFSKTTAGNTLNLNRYRGAVGGIKNFENYHWTLPSDVHNGDTLVTTATPVDLTHTTHRIADMQMSDNRLNNGDTITLIDKTQPATWGTANYQIHQGQFIVYDATLAQSNGTNNPFVLIIKTRGTGGGSAAHLNPQTKSYSEGRLAALGMLRQAEDLISTAGIDHIRIITRADKQHTLIPFFIANGSSQRYQTGSHIDLNGMNFAAGLASGLNFGSGSKATLGAFFEYGKGNYDTYNRFASEASVRGDGRSHYHGGGVFGRFDFANTGLGRVSTLPADQADGAYAEASLRTGRVNNTFNIDAKAGVLNGHGSSYHSQSPYYGGHLAAGYVFNFDDKQSLDTYARYLWIHMKNDKVSINSEPLRFNSTDSNRIQLGGRYAYALNDRFKPYFGAAYEYEFDGKAKAKAYEFNLDRPELKGSTGIFEMGFHLQPFSGNPAFSIDVNAQGFVGKRQGSGGNLKAKYQF